MTGEVHTFQQDEATGYPTLVMRVAYDGTDLHGFAKQPAVPTVQGSLESALEVLLRRPVPTVGAGRTDAGVHAVGQVVSTPIAPEEVPADLAAFTRSLNALSSPSVRVHDIAIAQPGFSARFDALSRTYRYLIAVGPVAPLFISRYAYHVARPLDIEAMTAGAKHLLGEHDFKSFCVTASAEGQRTNRRVDLIEVSRLETSFGEEVVEVVVRGNAFLHSMIRIIVGTLIEVGVGRREPAWVGEVLAACDREAAGPTAPPNGLTFVSVEYPSRLFD